MTNPTFHHPTVAESRAELARELRAMADAVRDMEPLPDKLVEPLVKDLAIVRKAYKL